MTRRPRRSGRRTAAYTAAATLLAADAAVAAYIAIQSRTAVTLVAAVALGYCGLVALGYVLAYGCSAAWQSARAAHHRPRPGWQPQGRPAPGTGARPVADGWGQRRSPVGGAR